MRPVAPKWRRSIRAQLIIGVSLVHMILMTSFVVDLVTRQKDFVRARATERAAHEAAQLAASALPQMVTKDLAGLHEILDSLSYDPSIRFGMVTDEKGRIIGHTDPRKAGKALLDATSRKQLAAPPKAGIVYSGPEMIEAASPVVIDKGVLGWAWVATDLTHDTEQIRHAERTGVLYACIAVLTGVIFAFVLANSITRPLRLLLLGADRLGREQLDKPVPVTTANEVGTVTVAFNEAMRRLRENRNALEKTRRELEAEVVERRRAQQQLEEVNRALASANESLQQFAYAASHDLQEPLRSVTGYSELLWRRYHGKLGTEADEFIEFIRAGGVRMQNLLRALLDYSKAGAKGGEPAHTVDTNACLRTALENLRSAISTSGAIVTCGELPPVRAHEIAVVQLFQNLVGNAIKYSPAAPDIRLWGDPDNNECRIAIKDNGIGIDPKQHQRIFGIFKRAHGGEYPGTGVGLAICSRIVERYGGRIWVDSALGRGSIFYFTLPLASEPSRTDSIAQMTRRLTAAAPRAEAGAGSSPQGL